MAVCPPDFTPDFSKANGLIAAVAQDAVTGEVLMLAWMNEEAWRKTLESGEAHYYSRSRHCLWHKGGTPIVWTVTVMPLSCASARKGRPAMKGTVPAFSVN